MELSRIEIRSNIYVMFKHSKSTTQAKLEMVTALGTAAPSLRCIQSWYKQFREDRQSFEDKKRGGRPTTAVTVKNIDAVREMVTDNTNVSYVEIQSALKIGTAAANSILKKHLQCRKLVSRWIPHELTNAQKAERVNWCKMILRIFKNGNSRRVFDIVTGDETWMSFSEPKTKRGNMCWTFESQGQPTSLRPSRFGQRRMFALFFRKSGFIAKKMLRKGETINAKWYKKALSLVFRNLKMQRPRTGLRGIILHQDNASSHTATITYIYFEQKGIILTGHPPHSPDLAPLDFFYNNEIKKALRGRKFLTEKQLVRGIEIAIKNITKSAHTRCFDEWFRRMERCIEAKGEYFEQM